MTRWHWGLVLVMITSGATFMLDLSYGGRPAGAAIFGAVCVGAAFIVTRLPRS